MLACRILPRTRIPSSPTPRYSSTSRWNGNRDPRDLQPRRKYPDWGNILGTIDPDSNLFIYNRIGAEFVKNNPGSLPAFTFSLGNLNLFSKVAPGTPSLILPAATVDAFFAPGNFGYSQLAGDTSFTEVGDTAIVFSRTLT